MACTTIQWGFYTANLPTLTAQWLHFNLSSLDGCASHFENTWMAVAVRFPLTFSSSMAQLVCCLAHVWGIWVRFPEMAMKYLHLLSRAEIGFPVTWWHSVTKLACLKFWHLVTFWENLRQNVTKWGQCNIFTLFFNTHHTKLYVICWAK